MFFVTYIAGLLVGLVLTQDVSFEKPNEVFLEQKRFLLSKDDNYKLQRYVSTILDLTLPKNIKPENYDLRAFQAQAKKNANFWYSSLFPRSVALAAGVSGYCTASIFSFRRMEKISQDIWSDDLGKSGRAKTEVEKILQYLKRAAEVNKLKADRIFNEIRQFSLKVEKDKTDVNVLYDKYIKKSRGAEMRMLRKEMDALRTKVESLTDEYEKAVVVAATTVTYAWIPVVGWIAAGTVAGIFGAKAVNLKKQIKNTKEELERIIKKFTYEEDLVQFAKSQLNSFTSIKNSINGILPVFGKIAGIWGAIRDDLDNILSSQLNLVDPTLPLLPFQTEIAAQLWLEVKQKADAYRSTAYISKEKKPNTNYWY